MEVSFDVHKIIKYAIMYNTVFSLQVVIKFGKGVVNQTNYQGFRFDVHFIQCQTSTDILVIVNEFVQYVQNYFQYLYITI